MKLTAYASQPHYLQHLFGVLPTHTLIWAPTLPLASLADAHGFPARVGIPRRSHDPIVVAGYRDALDVGRARPMCLVEHGAGQTYRDAPHMGYSGGPGWELLQLVLAPGPHAAANWQASYPSLQVAQIGPPRYLPASEPARNGRIGITFHWPCRQSQEAGTAFADWAAQLPQLAGALGHAHPRWGDDQRVRRAYDRAGIEWTADARELLAGCDVLVADNTSLLYEAAAIDRPTLALNARHWRKDIEHGLRFWSLIPGRDANPDEDLLHAIADASHPRHAPARRRAAAAVYDARDDPAEVLDAWVHSCCTAL